MKNLFLLSFICLLAATQSEALDANISYATFKSQGTGYIEVYLNVVGQTAGFVAVGEDGKKQASLEVVILFKQGDNIVKYDKYTLHSPVSDFPVNFVDLKRYALENGSYSIEVSIQDLNKEGEARKYASSFDLDYPLDQLSQSDVQLLASVKPAGPNSEQNPMVKSGYYFESLASHFYDKNAHLLIFYNETYNADKAVGEDYLLSYSIERLIGEGKTETVLIGHKRRSPLPVDAVLQQIDISKLESGNYQLIVELRDRNKQLLSKKSVLFQRSNPYLTTSREAIAATAAYQNEFVAQFGGEQLRYSLKAIAMLVDDHDGELLNTLIKENKMDAMRLYLFSFWAKESPTNPELAYDAYMEVARMVDIKFKSGFGYGFETDRGYVFMKYGAPNDVIPVENDPSAPPYEIWSYNQFPVTGQNNVKFLFYNPSLATNGYDLLHSTARGEVNNPRWELELYRNAPNDLQGSNYIDGTRMQDNVGRYASRLMKDY